MSKNYKEFIKEYGLGYNALLLKPMAALNPLRKKEQPFLVNKNIKNQMMMTITKQHQVTQVQKLKSLFILKSLNKCMVRLEI